MSFVTSRSRSRLINPGGQESRHLTCTPARDKVEARRLKVDKGLHPRHPRRERQTHIRIFYSRPARLPRPAWACASSMRSRCASGAAATSSKASASIEVVASFQTPTLGNMPPPNRWSEPLALPPPPAPSVPPAPSSVRWSPSSVAPLPALSPTGARSQQSRNSLGTVLEQSRKITVVALSQCHDVSCHECHIPLNSLQVCVFLFMT